MAGEGAPGRTRFLMISTGCSGASPLAAILADAGANFGMESPNAWRQIAGAFEHDEVQRACMADKTARKFARLSDMWWGFRKLRRFHARRVQTALQRLFSQADYANSMDLVWLIHTIFKMDWDPRIILVYRDFENVAMSSYLAFAWTHAESEERYLETYRTGLTAMHLFGGCAIGYDEILDPQETAWAAALAEVTGLDKAALLGARANRLKPLKRRHAHPPMSTAASELYTTLQAYKGRVLPASGHVYEGDKH